MADPAQTQTPPNDGPTLAVETPPVPQNTEAPAPARVDAQAAPVSAEPGSLPAAAVESGAAPSNAADAKPEVVQPSSVPTLLEETSLETKKDETKPEVKAEGETDKRPDAKTDPEAKVEPEKAPEAPKLDPVDYKYELPETLKMDDAQKGEFHQALDAFRGETSNPQKLIDLHNKVMANAMEEVRRNQYATFNDTRKQWQDKVRADEELGGAGFETTMRAVARMRDLFVAPEHRDAFNEMLRVTGAGDHPEFLRVFHRAARFFDEPRMPPTDIKPPPRIGQRRASAATLYPNTNFDK